MTKSSFPVVTRFTRGLAIVGAVAMAVVSPTAATASTTPRTGGMFDNPTAIATQGGNLWVTNQGTNSVTELSSAGAFERAVTTSRDGIRQPQAIAADAGAIFVANETNTITELNGSNGSLLRIISAHSYHLMDPIAFAVNGPDLWILNATGNSLTEIVAATGALVRTVTNQPYGPVRFDSPTALTVSGANLWVTNAANNSVTELKTKTGAFVQTITSSADGFATPAGIASDGAHVWISDSATDSLTELSASTGALDQVIGNSSLDGGYGFNAPSVVLAGSGVVYVVSPPGGSPMVTQVADGTGIANWMMCNTNYPFNFLNPAGLAIDGANLWVVNNANNSLSEMNAASGVWVKDVT